MCVNIYSLEVIYNLINIKAFILKQTIIATISQIMKKAEGTFNINTWREFINLYAIILKKNVLFFD